MIILFNKPYGVLSQFSPEGDARTLAEFITTKHVYPAGRLDKDSEGLLLLTDDGRFQARLADPKYKREKTYWVQVEGAVNQLAIDQLRQGVLLKDGPSKPAKVRVIDTPVVWPRQPPIRVRKSIPDHWLEISIREGRNRQVRRMTAAVNLPTLRLIRVAIGDYQLGDLQPGEQRQLSK